MTTIDQIRKRTAMGLVMAAGVCIHVGAGVGEQVALAQAKAPYGFVQIGPDHEFEMPGYGITAAPVVPQFGIGPVVPGPAHPHSRSLPHFLPYSNNPSQFGAALAADSAAYAGFGFGFGGPGFGGYGYPGMMGAGMIGSPGMYGYWGGSGSGIGMSVPPMPEIGSGTYRAGNQLPPSNVGMGMGVGDPAAQAAGNAGQFSNGAPSDDAFDRAESGRPSPTRHVRSRKAKATRRPAVRKHLPQPPRKAESRVTEKAPRRPEDSGAHPERANTPQEKPSTLKPEGTQSAPRKSVLGSAG